MQDIFWEPIDGNGFEHLKVIRQKDFIVFDGIIIRKIDDKTYRVFYQLTCDNSWKFRKLEITVESDTTKSLSLSVDKSGLWYDDKGQWYQELDGCIDPDISFTPLTNTFPINRLNINVGETVNIKTAYISLPELKVTPVLQSYTCKSKVENESIFVYKNLDSGFEAGIQVDKDSFVVNYPDLFKRI